MNFSSVHIVGILTIPGQRMLNIKWINPLCELKVSPKQFLVSSRLQISYKLLFRLVVMAVC